MRAAGSCAARLWDARIDECELEAGLIRLVQGIPADPAYKSAGARSRR